MNKIDIINETVAFYGEDPSRRAVNVNEEGTQVGCEYLNEQGKMCALGRCFTEKGMKEWGNFGLDAEILADELKYGHSTDLDSILKPEYRGHSVEFWCDLQAFHDYSGHFIEAGLSGAGEKVAAQLRKKHGEMS